MPRQCDPCLWRGRGLCSTPRGEPCPTHCQCKACMDCPRPPAGRYQRTGTAKKWWKAMCNSCNKYCKGEDIAGSGASQQSEVQATGLLVPPLPSEGLQAPSAVHVPSMPPASTQPDAVPSTGCWQGTMDVRSVGSMQRVLAPASASGLFVTRRLASDATSLGTWNRHDTPFPIGVACTRIERDTLLGRRVEERGLTMVTQVHFLRPGSGQLRLPVTFGQQTAHAGRVALSWILLHLSDLKRLCGREGGQLDALLRKIAEVDVAVTVTGAMGKLDGVSSGLLLLLSMFTALTKCYPLAKTAMTGEVTLEGLVLRVGGVPVKATAAAEAGMHNMVVPLSNDGGGFPLSQESRSLHVQGVSTVAQALQHTIQGWRRVPIALTPLRSYLAVIHVPATYIEAVEIEKVEVAVVPGTGQVHITGKMELPVENALRDPEVFIRDHMQHIEVALKRAAGRPVRWKFDLGTKTWLDGSNEPGRIDVHINLPNASYPKVGPVYGAAAVVGLISLMAGLALPADMAVAAHVCASGRMGGFLVSTPATLQASAEAGIAKLYLADHDADHVMRQMAQHAQQIPQNMQVIGRPAIPELLLDVFSGAAEL